MNIKNLSKDKIVLALVVGILLFLLSFPLEKLSTVGSGSDEEKELQAISGSNRLEYQQELEKELKTLLEKVRGAGQVRVMVILADSGEKVVEKDVQTESSSTDDTSEENYSLQENTVMENGQIPWVSREILPQVTGIAVVAEGGGNAVVQSEISGMLEALFGLPAHKIKVLEGDF